VFDQYEEHCMQDIICPRHRDQFGVRWRCNRKICACPIEWAGHGVQPPKGDRGITMQQSKLLCFLTNVLVPVGSPICRSSRLKLKDSQSMQMSPPPEEDPVTSETQVVVEQEQSHIVSQEKDQPTLPVETPDSV
ncbi:hypothetical protein QZH41_008924, partial [Actinostola sp. cb2023]